MGRLKLLPGFTLASRPKFLVTTKENIHSSSILSKEENILNLIAQLKNKDSFVRMHSAKTLGNLRNAGSNALGELEKLMGDPDNGVRGAAIEAVAKIKGQTQCYR